MRKKIFNYPITYFLNRRVHKLSRSLYDLIFIAAGSLHIGLTIRIKSKRCGYFGDLAQTINAIRFAEIVGLNCEVDWNDESLYYDENCGNNVWEYYFIQSKFSFSGKAIFKLTVPYFPTAFEFPCYSGMSTKDSTAAAISKFCRLKQEVVDIVEAYISDNFSGETLGVHIRGTDAANGYEGRTSPSLEKLHLKIDNWLSARKNGTIFLATDDLNAMNRLSATFGRRLHFRECLRSDDGNSIHGHYDNGQQGSGYQKGLDVLIDSLILSRCTEVFYRGSRVAWFASSKNPGLIMTEY